MQQEYEREIIQSRKEKKKDKKSKLKKRYSSSSDSDDDRYYRSSRRHYRSVPRVSYYEPEVVYETSRPRRSYSVARVETLPVDDYAYSTRYVPVRSRGYLSDYWGGDYYGAGYSGYRYGYGTLGLTGRSYYDDSSLYWRNRYPYYSGYYGSSYWKNYYPYQGHSRYYDDYYTPYWRSYSPYYGKYHSYLSGSSYNDGYYEGLRDSTLGYRRRYYL